MWPCNEGIAYGLEKRSRGGLVGMKMDLAESAEWYFIKGYIFSISLTKLSCCLSKSVCVFILLYYKLSMISTSFLKNKYCLETIKTHQPDMACKVFRGPLMVVHMQSRVGMSYPLMRHGNMKCIDLVNWTNWKNYIYVNLFVWDFKNITQANLISKYDHKEFIGKFRCVDLHNIQ